MKKSSKINFGNIILSYGFYILIAVLLIVISFFTNNFFTIKNLFTMLSDAAMLFIVSAGATLVIITGNLDLSVGSVAFLSVSAIVVGMHANISPVLSVFLAILIGLIVGSINGFLVVKLKMNSMLVTLGWMIAYRGVGQILSGSGATTIPQILLNFGLIKFGGLSLLFLIVLIIMIILHIVLIRTRFGTYCYAIGNNKNSAEKLGLPVSSVVFWAFVISGGCAALSGLVSMFNLGVVQIFIGNGLEFNAIAAVVIGGTSLYGGKGRIFPGTFFGVFCLSVINNALGFLGVTAYAYPLIIGLVIFIAMYIDSLSKYKISVS